MKIRDRENRKIITGFRDMADFVTGNRDPIPPLVGPTKIRKSFLEVDTYTEFHQNCTTLFYVIDTALFTAI